MDPEARHSRKSPDSRRDGYRAHLAAEPETGLITDEQPTKAAGAENSDAAVAEQFLDREDEPRTWYGDSAYGTGDLLLSDQRRRAPGRDQTQAAAGGRARRLHRR